MKDWRNPKELPPRSILFPRPAQKQGPGHFVPTEPSHAFSTKGRLDSKTVTILMNLFYVWVKVSVELPTQRLGVLSVEKKLPPTNFLGKKNPFSESKRTEHQYFFCEIGKSPLLLTMPTSVAVRWLPPIGWWLLPIAPTVPSRSKLLLVPTTKTSKSPPRWESRAMSTPSIQDGTRTCSPTIWLSSSCLLLLLSLVSKT